MTVHPYRHWRVVQLCPIQGPYYRVGAYLEGGDPLFFKERVEALALVDEWLSIRGDETPGEFDDVERHIRTLRFAEGYFEPHDTDDDHQFIGFYWKEELDDENIIRHIEARAQELIDAEARRREKRIASGGVK